MHLLMFWWLKKSVDSVASGVWDSGTLVGLSLVTTGFWLVRVTLALGMAAMPRFSGYLFFWIMCLIC